MNLERLQAIQERLDAATPGPWAEAPWGNGIILTERWCAEDASSEKSGPFMCIHTITDEDAEFVAHAPDDIAYLLNEVLEVLRSEPALARKVSAQQIPELVPEMMNTRRSD